MKTERKEGKINSKENRTELKKFVPWVQEDSG
jgi:hypothetical protein